MKTKKKLCRLTLEAVRESRGFVKSDVFAVIVEAPYVLYHWKLASANHLIFIAEALVNLKNQGKNINFGWCKAYCGICNNETVDLLAKEASSSGSLRHAEEKIIKNEQFYAFITPELDNFLESFVFINLYAKMGAPAFQIRWRCC
uniref:RNase H type-1 domain-containing protein n=1 Tax=Rhodnius prolixus TaxID=13249 RepID=T1IGA5_RHOPR